MGECINVLKSGFLKFKPIHLRHDCHLAVTGWGKLHIADPSDFVTKVKQINSQSDLIWMTSFAAPSYLTIRSSANIILI